MHSKLLSILWIARCVLAGNHQYPAHETETCTTTNTTTTSATVTTCSPKTITISGPVDYCQPTTVTTTCSETVTSCSKSDYWHATTATVTETSNCQPVIRTIYTGQPGQISTRTITSLETPDYCVPSTTTLYSDKPGPLSTTTVYDAQPCQSSTQTITVFSGSTATSISYVTATSEITLPASTVTKHDVSTITALSDRTVYRDSTTSIVSTQERTSYITKVITSSVPLCGGGTTYINSYNATIISISTKTLANTTLTSTLYSTTTSTITEATQTVYSTRYSTTTENITVLTTSYLPSTTTIPIPGSTETKYFPSIITVTACDGNATSTVYIPSGTATITSFYPNYTTVTEPGSTSTIYLPSNATGAVCCNGTGGGGSGGGNGSDIYALLVGYLESTYLNLIDNSVTNISCNSTGGGGNGGGGNGSDIFALLVGYLESTYINLIDRSVTNNTDSIATSISVDLRNFFETNPIDVINANISLNSTDLSYLNRTIAGVLYNYMQYQFEDRSSPVNQSIRVEINETPWWAIVLVVLLILFGLLILAGLIWLIFFRRTHVCRGKKSLHGGKEVIVCAVDGSDVSGGGDEVCQRCQKPRSVCGCDQGPLLSS